MDRLSSPTQLLTRVWPTRAYQWLAQGPLTVGWRLAITIFAGMIRAVTQLAGDPRPNTIRPQLRIHTDGSTGAEVISHSMSDLIGATRTGSSGPPCGRDGAVVRNRNSAFGTHLPRDTRMSNSRLVIGSLGCVPDG